jgi:uncharacterized protein
MRFFIALLFTFFIAFAPAFAQPGAAPATQSFAPTVEENSLLWKISGKDLPTPSYLYGTIHLIGKDDFFLTDSTRAAIDRAQLVTFEINMEDMMNLPAQLGLMMKSFMSDGKTLRDLITEEEYALVKAHFDKMGLPLFLFEKMKPMFLTVFASMDMSPDAMSSGEMVSYEMKIMDIAKQQKKKMDGLETAEYQMSMFDSIPYEAQAQMLVESIKSADAGSDEMEEMVKLYKNQDINGMVTMMRADEEGVGGYEDLLLVTRNKNWIPVMGEMMMKEPAFFAVGAGHLGGENGVVALLRKEGYTVVPVR